MQAIHANNISSIHLNCLSSPILIILHYIEFILYTLNTSMQGDEGVYKQLGWRVTDHTTGFIFPELDCLDPKEELSGA